LRDYGKGSEGTATPQTFCHASNRFTYILVLFTVFSFCFTTVSSSAVAVNTNGALWVEL